MSGIDLYHGAIALHEDLVPGLDALGRRLGLSTFEAHLPGHLDCLCRRQALDDVNENLHDGGGIGRSDVLDGGASMECRSP